MKEFIEKLIGRLEERRNEENNNSLCEMNENGHTLDFECSVGKTNAFNESISIVNELAEEYNNGWIPCSERLPNVGMTVLCYWKKYNRYDNTTSYYYTLMHRNEDYQWISDFGMCNGDVIAWQPLPKSYQPKGE